MQRICRHSVNLHDEVANFAKHSEDNGCKRPKAVTDDDALYEKFANIPNNDNKTIFHPSFMENMFQGCKRPLAKKKVKSTDPPSPLDPILVNNAF